MMNARRNRSINAFVAAMSAICFAAFGLGGCATGNADEALMQENLELRQQRAELESQLADCEQRYAMLDSQNRQLGQLGSGATGFEGIDGVTVGRNAG